MKIALVAFPEAEEPRATPPLPLCYVAAFLEQQRHIVRVYDLALQESQPAADRLDAVRSFRPHITIIAADQVTHAQALAAALGPIGLTIPVSLGTRGHIPQHLSIRMLGELNQALPDSSDEKNVIMQAFLALADDLDRLPFPARHLLALELYPHITAAGDLQTPVLVGRVTDQGALLRQSALLLAELRTIVREHGIHHVIFEGPALTADLHWLRTLLQQLIDAHLGIKWEGHVGYAGLTRDLLEQARRAGCEGLTFEFAALEALDHHQERAALTEAVRQARELGMRANGRIQLDPAYSSIPAVVDMAATFSLDDVRFVISRPEASPQQSDESAEFAAIVALAREHYQISRSRQYFIDRFGSYLGLMIWHIGRLGLLGRNWQRRANDHNAQSEIALERGQ